MVGGKTTYGGGARAAVDAAQCLTQDRLGACWAAAAAAPQHAACHAPPTRTLSIVLHSLHRHHQLELDALALGARPAVGLNLRRVTRRAAGEAAVAARGAAWGRGRRCPCPHVPQAARTQCPQSPCHLPPGTSTHFAEGGCLHSVSLADQVVGVPQVLPCSITSGRQHG